MVLGWLSRNGRDPRIYQICSLSALLLYGIIWLEFDIAVERVALLLSAVVIFQFIFGRLWHLPFFDPKSALISGLSLCLLLRTNSPGLACLAAAIAVGSKFFIRCNGKHLFNPTNFSLVIMLIVFSDAVWVSPGQWGSAAFLGFSVACFGGLVVNRAARADVTLAFLAAYLGIIFGRSLWLGEPMSIPVHRLQNGALLIFAFFMISDPRTTPDSRIGRIIFAALVAGGAAFVQFKLFRTNGLIWSLALFSLCVPAFDLVFRGRPHEWAPPIKPATTKTKGAIYEPVLSV